LERPGPERHDLVAAVDGEAGEAIVDGGPLPVDGGGEVAEVGAERAVDLVVAAVLLDDLL
jgi:hypothetical protein